MHVLLPLLEAELADPDGYELCEAVEALVERIGWPTPLAEAMTILADDGLRRFWRQAMAVAFWAQDPGEVRIPPGGDALDCVARLYFCLEREPALDENLAWSLASRLKGVSYLSDWNPLLDPQVCLRMASMRLGLPIRGR
ncbi:hypothetical protein [Lysobacter enzymogenes]|uniref:hypothetical protein n=1 Tax=Lysobacter enzymogenes TaxID=69 RepID=UPI0008983EA6|nr:hypothetical protein [Lysobacter enzymogenes]SDY25634.1 hypothetical protein SAMN05421681_11527 [Lysobacter enzymogenes]